MKKQIFILSLFCITSALQAKVGDNMFIGATESRQLHVNNRILANVNGKLISVIDIMKKMDVQFYRQFPEYTDNVEARQQFYNYNWKRSLQDLIDKELILADATENKMPISNGDVRQEMESMFGPNIIANLDKIDMTYEQASEMLRGDIIIRRMLHFRVNSKAMRAVTPQIIRDAYEKYAKENQTPSQWIYQVISIRNPDASVGANAASKAHELLAGEVALGQLSTELNRVGVNDGTKINISEEFVQTEAQVNPSHLEVLKGLAAGHFSPPVKQTSRVDSSTVYRIFHLKAKQEGGAKPYKEVEKDLKEALINERMDAESEIYLKKLRNQFGISEAHFKELADDSFQPFVLQ